MYIFNTYICFDVQFQAFNNLHVMYHEATACHVTGDIVDLLTIILPVLKVIRHFHEKKGKLSCSNFINLHIAISLRFIGRNSKIL